MLLLFKLRICPTLATPFSCARLMRLRTGSRLLFTKAANDVDTQQRAQQNAEESKDTCQNVLTHGRADSAECGLLRGRR
jgi:hypothetical protein